MKTFKEWLNLKENYYMGRPHGPMGPDGKIYGHAGGPVERISGSNTWRTAEMPSLPPPIKIKNNESEGLWRANSPQIRLGYLARYLAAAPDAEKLNLHNMDWKDLPKEAQIAVEKEMNSKVQWKKY